MKIAAFLCFCSTVVVATVPMYPNDYNPTCTNNNRMCEYWSRRNECTKNWMRLNCQKACDTCYLSSVCRNDVNLQNCPPRVFEIEEHEIHQKMDKAAEVFRLYDEARYPKMVNGSFPLSMPTINTSQVTFYKPGIKLNRIIFNGNQVAEGNFKHHVQLIDYSDGTICGGTAIGTHIIVSAAHCVIKYYDKRYEEPVNAGSFIMKVGSVKYDQGEPLRLTWFDIHEEYLQLNDKATKREHDIAVIYTKDIIPDENQIKLASKHEKDKEQVKLSGLGQYQNTQPKFPDILQVGVYTILGDEEPEDTEHTFVSTGESGPGDSGGGLVWQENGTDVLGGIFRGVYNVNSNKKLPPRFVSEYIRVVDFLDWIKQERTEAG